MEHATSPHHAVLVITTKIDDFKVKRILIDDFDVKGILVYSQSSTVMLFPNALLTMGKTNKDMDMVEFPLFGFLGRPSCGLGQHREGSKDLYCLHSC